MPAQNQQPEPLDFRIYLGMIFFRWQTIVVCFLYALLGAVIYIQVTPKQYMARCKLLVYRDPNLKIGTDRNPMRSWASQMYILRHGRIHNRVINKLREQWGPVLGDPGKMRLHPSARRSHSYGPSLEISLRCPHPEYGAAYLRLLVDEFLKEWSSMQRQAYTKAVALLENELEKLEEKITAAEEDVIEYERLHDVARIRARGAAESGYLSMLIGRRVALTTELMMMEAQFPQLQDESVAVIAEVGRLTRDTGMMDLTMPEASNGANNNGNPGRRPVARSGGVPVPDELRPEADGRDGGGEDAGEGGDDEYERGWHALRMRLISLEQQEKKLAKDLLPNNPRLKSIRGQISGIKSKLDFAAELQLRNMMDRHRALNITLKTVEDAEYKWQAKDMFAARRQSELRRIQAIVGRYDSNYRTLYSRLHEMRVNEEMEADHIRIVEGAHAGSTPIWPDPMKILLVAVVIGLASGFGIALGSQVLDNKVQTINDVEKALGIPFLGGVPYWVHSGLEKAIRPIVTEEHSTGAIEAYRALRTSIITALNKMNEKTVLVTSADSREGKTLTALNLSIMIAQMNKRVLLVDMDMRRGRLHRSLGLEREPGFADVLKEGRSLREAVISTRIENLDLIPTGSTTDNSAELLQSTSLVSLFVDVQDDYDYILVDTSPVLRVTDTVIAATQGLGVVLYVARVNHTPKPMIKYSLDMLSDSRVLGLVMNSIEMHKISSLYYSYQYPNYAYYSNAYSYGYNYYHYGDRADLERRTDHRPMYRVRRVKRWFQRHFSLGD